MKSKRAQLKIQEMSLTNNLQSKLVADKRAQLKIQEMSFMLVAVVVLFVIVGLFVVTVYYFNLHKEATLIFKNRAISAITTLSDSPELNCMGSRSNCIDSDKLIVLIERKSYSNFWPFNSLSVIRVDSFNKSENSMIECTKDNYPNCDRFVVYTKKKPNEVTISSFVALCRKDFVNNYPLDKCEIAVVVAGSEVKVVK